MTNPTYSGRITEMKLVQIFRQMRDEIKHDFAQKKAEKATQS